jgi:protein-disulfide isomerase
MSDGMSEPEPQPSTPAPPTPPAPQRPAGDAGWLPGLVLAVALLALGVAFATWLNSTQQNERLREELAALRESYQQIEKQVAQIPGGTGPIGRTIDVSKAPGRGRDDAVVTLIEFSDYECPFCIRHVQQTMPLIDKNYIQSGKIRYVFRDFPIASNHPQAIRAHEAAQCWDLHHLLFSAPGSHTPPALEDRAKEAGLDMSSYRACIAAGKETPAIRESGSLADSLGATGTPWFFLGIRDLATNQVRIVKPIGGAQPYDQFAVAIDDVLRQTEPR